MRSPGREIHPGPHTSPCADNTASSRYTILDIVATNAVGLLYRISRVIASHQCDVALVLIATEGEKAIDVFHITRGGAKLTEQDEASLKADLEGMLQGPSDEPRSDATI